MAINKEVKVVFSGEDKTGAAAESAKKGIKEVSNATETAKGVFKGFVGLFAAEKVIGFFKDSIKAAADANPAMAAQFDKMANTFKGMQASVGQAIVGNKELMSAVLKTIQFATPIIVGSIQLIISTVDIMIDAFKRAFTSLKLIFELMTGKISIKEFITRIGDNFKGAIANFKDEAGKVVRATYDAMDTNLEQLGKKVDGKRETAKPKADDTIGEITLLEPNYVDQQYNQAIKLREAVTMVFEPVEANQIQDGFSIFIENMQSIIDLAPTFADSVGNMLTDAVYAFSDSLAIAFYQIGQGGNVFQSLANAFKRAVGQMVAAEGQQQMLTGLAKIAAGIWPPNPASIAAGTKQLAIGGAMMTLAGVLGGGGGSRPSGVGGGGAVGSRSNDDRRLQDESRRRGTSTIVVQGSRFLDTSDPFVMDAFVKAVRETGTNNLVVAGA